MTLADDCACGARPGPELVHCHRCHDSMPHGDLDQHLRLTHPDEEPRLDVAAVRADDQMLDGIRAGLRAFGTGLVALLVAFRDDADLIVRGQQ